MKLHLTYNIYEDLFVPTGKLPRINEKYMREVSAAWHFARLANRVLHERPNEIIMEGEADPFTNLRTLLESVQKLYQIQNLEDMMARMSAVRAIVYARGGYWDSRFDAWIASGGKAYNLVTREDSYEG